MKTVFVCATLIAFALQGEVVRMDILERSPVLHGRPFGAAGAFEQLRGIVQFAVDPAADANRGITDIRFAPRDADGRVHFSADLFILRPSNPQKRNETILFEVVNRGKRGMLSTFNRARPDDPFGDGLLLNAGYTLVWLGWQHDVPESDLMRVQVPVAKGVTGLVRGEYTPDRPVHVIPLGDTGHVPYPVSDASRLTLTVRNGVYGTRQTLPPEAWSLAEGKALRLTAAAEPGRIYEFIYPSADPAVAGLGLAGIRDLVSHLKRTERYRLAIGFGVSQSAMVLRAFVYEGFNADESGARVFDGILAHVAGGRRSTFQRFTQPSRTAGPLRNASFSPTEQFPFSDLTQKDSITSSAGGILHRALETQVAPKIFYTNSTYEYWGSAASLTHTTPDGTRDVRLPDTTRMYVFAGGQHGPAAFPPRADRGQNLANHNDYRWHLRALLRRLHAWVESGTPPPDSAYPTIRQRTLVPLAAYRFPRIPGARVPAAIHTPHALRTGASEPPASIGAYSPRVPQADEDGNDLGGIRMPELHCAIGTYTGWNLRTPSIGAADTLLGNTGSYLPFPRTEGERVDTADPRRSVLERFTDEKSYTRCVERAGVRLASQGLLLQADVPALVDQAAAHWRWRMELSDIPLRSSRSR